MSIIKKLISTLIVCTPLSSLAHKLNIACPHGKIPFQVELAQTPQECQKGLMFRTDLSEDEGMLFLFPQPRPSSMWMKNTPLSLDMIFCDEAGQVLAIYEKAVPFSLKSIGPVNNTMQVLEVRGGTVEKHKISTKCTLKLEH
ncbi:MAG: DUF192 domain-containing protein [Proteobacteria bacterium]|nr:DUF192 domain-containing protein [Pseudomonadota bacterium]